LAAAEGVPPAAAEPAPAAAEPEPAADDRIEDLGELGGGALGGGGTEEVRLGRIVVSEIEAPKRFGNMV
jgi:hypothetical protein